MSQDSPRHGSVRSFVGTSFLVAWSVAIVACSLTDLDALKAGGPVDTDGTDDSDAGELPMGGEDADVVVDASSDVDGGQDGEVPIFDAGNDPDATDLDASSGPTLYAPAEGEYVYVQNTSAYSSGAFDASANKLGIDYSSIDACGSNFNATRPQAASMPSTVVRDPASSDGVCWTIHIDIRPNDGNGGHQEDESFCARDGGLYARGQASTVQDQKWVFGAPIGTQSARATTICDPTTVYLLPDMKPGDSWLHACEGTTTATSGKYVSMGGYQYIGRETMPIDKVTEEVFHVRRDRAVSGVMKGREVTEFFLAVKDGMPLRVHRWTQITTPISMLCIKEAIYDNYGSDWLLKTRTPKPLPATGGAK